MFPYTYTMSAPYSNLTSHMGMLNLDLCWFLLRIVVCLVDPFCLKPTHARACRARVRKSTTTLELW